MIPYQYALLRYRNSLTSGEVINIGILAWVPGTSRTSLFVSNRRGRHSKFFEDFNGLRYKAIVDSLKNEMEAKLLRVKTPKNISPILEELIPEQNGCFLWSNPMGGVAPDFESRVYVLFEEFVTRHEPQSGTPRVDEKKIAAFIRDKIAPFEWANRIEHDIELSAPYYSHTFRFGWMNGRRQLMEPVSFDFANTDTVIDRATSWEGKLKQLREAGHDLEMTPVVFPPRGDYGDAIFNQAVKIMGTVKGVREVVLKNQLDDFLPRIEQDLTTK